LSLLTVNEMISVIFKLNDLGYIYIYIYIYIHLNKEEKYYSRHISCNVEPSYSCNTSLRWNTIEKILSL